MNNNTNTTINTEIWKEIPEFPYYEASNMGRIRSLKSGKPKIMKQRLDKDGYCKIGLMQNGKQKTMQVHRLIAMTFLPNPEELPQVNHKDEIKDNNNVDNLEWVTSRQNVNYKDRTYRQAATFSDYIIVCMELNKSYPSMYAAAKDLGVYQSGISAVLNGAQHTCGGYHFKRIRKEK